jgi:RNA polymerase sigma-70 factor (ECF subfamily)
MPGKTGVSDVLQETNITLWKKRSKFQLGTSFTAWSFAVARYTFLEFRRKTSRSKEFSFSDDLLELLAFTPDQLEPSKAESRFSALESCLGKLSDSHRELIRLRYEREISIEQFAQKHGKSAGAIRVSLYQIRAGLRKCINLHLRRATNQ